MCGIAGIIGRLDEPNRAALERMSDAMVHRGPDAERDVGLRAGRPRLGRAAGPPPALHPRPLARRCPAHGGPGDRARGGLQRRDLQLRRPAAAPGGRGAEVPVHRRHGRHAARARPARAGRGELAARHVRLRLLGPEAAPAAAGQGSPGHQAPLPGPVVGSGRGLVGGLRLRASRPAGLRAAGHASPRPAGRGQRCVERLRGRSRYGRQGRRAPLAGAAARVRRRRQGGPPGGLLAHPRPRPRSDHGRGRAGRHPGGGAEAPPRQRRAAGGLPLRRRGLLGRWPTWPSAPPRAPSTPSPWPSRSRSSTRGRSRGGSPPPSAPSTTRWC